MKLINQVLRGVVIGVANIIPGVSGGTMMVSMGIYDTLIHCITHLFSEFRQSVCSNSFSPTIPCLPPPPSSASS